ncbi:MAG: TonB-dependent receptor [Candidatus Aminicenantes bacterium]|nr:TonB-dependent receptor [Candidatus Aminicenantes bacterium]
MKRKSHLLMAFLVLIAIPLSGALEMPQQRQKNHHGQTRFFFLRGRVEGWQGEPVKKAAVLIPELGISVETDESGGYEIGQIPSGRFHLEVYADGYMDYVSDPMDFDRDRVSQTIILIKKIEEEIVVTATRTPKLYAETPVKTEVITTTDLQKGVAVNLAEALTQTTGVRVENDCQNCNFTQVRINGMEGKYTQILIDSSPLVSAMTGVYGLEQIPVEMLDRIEIIKGGGSALYGGNAVAGVINVITKEPQETKSNLKVLQESISSRPSTHLSFHSGILSKDLNTKAFLFANYQTREPVDLNGDDFSELGTISNTSFGLNFYNYFETLNGKIKLGFFRIFEERRGGDLFDQPPHEANTAEWIKTDQLGLSSEWSHSLTERIHYILSFSLVNAKRNTYYGSHRDPNAYGTTDNPLFFGNFQMNYQAGGHVFSLGVQYKRDHIEDIATGYNRMIRETYEETGVFLQDDFKISKSFTLLTGVRVNWHTALRKAILTPRLSVLFNISKTLAFRTSFSTGFRAPQVFDEDLHITQVGGEGMMVTHSADLKEERSFNVSTGFDYGKQIGRNLIQFSLEGFYTRLTNTFILHEISRIENARILERINGAGAKVYGVSVELGLILGKSVSFASGWTAQHSVLDEPEPDFQSCEFFRTPRFHGFTSVTYKNERLLSVDLSLEYTGSMKAPHYSGYIEVDRLETTRPFWVLNLKMQRFLRVSESCGINIFMGGYNLPNSYQKDLDKGIDRDSGYVYGPAKPRSFYGGFDFSF